MRSIVRIGIGLVLAGGVVFSVWMTTKRSDFNPRGDAVVVHAGGAGERLDHALDLMERGAAPVLVIMRGDVPTWPQARRLCGNVEPYEVVCPFPDPDTTIGEALALRDLVAEREWDRVVTVTSNYHLRRATYLDAKCSNIDVLASGASVAVPWPVIGVRAIREVAGMVQALILTC